MKHSEALVLGAGMQGALSALMLANRGLTVTLIDRADAMLQGSSLNYEGRIHSGMLYAMDKTFNTATRMAKDAVAFAPAIERILGMKLDWARLRSVRSTYLVHRNSHLSADELTAFWTQLEHVIMAELEDPEMTYVGARPKRFFWPTDCPEEAKAGIVTHAFKSEETCVDQVSLNAIVKAAVNAHPRIVCALGQEVLTVEGRGADRYTVTTSDGQGARTQHQAGLVVNCLWEARGLIDRVMGISDGSTESLRLKYSLLLKRSEYFDRLGSFILTHGAFGSVVTSPFADTAFASWYPACVEGMIETQQLPDHWRALCSGPVPDHIRDRVLAENVAGFREVFPDFPMPEVKLIKAGIIVAHGLRDIDKTDSGFHRRDEYPIRRKGNYLSVATGKYTSIGRNVLRLESELFDKATERPTAAAMTV
ncbi:FAD-dependent oxidoreductase [Aliiroseovarius sp. 2305UL8-7]|uniref:FAD-dependent oxidoreductase n=1 Tax=Aliiroseovarius conchicola TaxID=3121637 RepID=UPI0035298BD9